MTLAHVMVADLPRDLVHGVAEALTAGGYSVQLAADQRGMELLRASYPVPVLIVSAGTIARREEAEDYDLAVTRLLEAPVPPRTLFKALDAAS